MSRALLVCAVALAALSSTSTRAQLAPLATRAVEGRVGVESLGLPTLALTYAPEVTILGVNALVGTVANGHAQSAALLAGGQLRQDITPWLFVREAALAGPLVSVVDGVAAGATADVVVQAGFVIGDVVVAVGPVLDAAVVVERAASWRLSPGAGLAVVVPVVDIVNVVVDVDGGYDFGGVGAGALSGRAFVGAQVEL